MTSKTVLTNFTVEFLGVEYPDSFGEYGVSTSDYEFSTYGIGDTEAEALDDCIEMMAQCCGFDVTDKVEKRIRAAYGDCDADTTVADVYSGEEGDEEAEFEDFNEQAWFHVGIKWNEKTV